MSQLRICRASAEGQMGNTDLYWLIYVTLGGFQHRSIF